MKEFISRLRLVYWSTLEIANDLPIFASYYAFVTVSLTWLAYFLSRDYLSYINYNTNNIIFTQVVHSPRRFSVGAIFTRFFLYFLFLSDEGPMLETLDYTIRIGSTPTILYIKINNSSSEYFIVLCYLLSTSKRFRSFPPDSLMLQTPDSASEISAFEDSFS